jgi:hypothetical protein
VFNDCHSATHDPVVVSRVPAWLATHPGVEKANVVRALARFYGEEENRVVVGRVEGKAVEDPAGPLVI